jgi:hypothetical protein
MESSYSTYHRKRYEENKDKINEKRREYAKLHQREYNKKLRAINPPKPVGRPRKTNSNFSSEIPQPVGLD